MSFWESVKSSAIPIILTFAMSCAGTAVGIKYQVGEQVADMHEVKQQLVVMQKEVSKLQTISEVLAAKQQAQDRTANENKESIKTNTEHIYNLNSERYASK